MTPSAPRDRFVPSRRQFLAAAGAALLPATAGCSAIIDAIGDRLLQHVNVFNGLDRAISGSIEGAGPEGATVLEETFDLAASGESDDDGGSAAMYGDVWDGAGTYEVTVELDGEIDGTSQATESVVVESPGNDKLAVMLGGSSTEAPIGFAVGESISDFNATRSDAS